MSFRQAKGFVVSFDSMLALFVIFAFLAASFAILARADFGSSDALFLQAFSLDTVSVMHESGMLERAVQSEDSSEIFNFLNQLPYSYCARAEMREQGSSFPFLISARERCRNVPANSFYSKSVFSARILGKTSFYTLELRSWIAG